MISLVGLFSSCLDTELTNAIAVDDFFTSDADAKAYLNGVYGGFRDRSARNYIPGGEYCYQAVSEISADNIIFGPGAQSGTKLQYTYAEWGIDLYVTSSVWSGMWLSISRANTGIDNFYRLDNEDTANQYTAEAKVARAWWFADLVYLYGDLPFVTDSKFDISSNPSRESSEVIIDFCISEILDAIDYLPESYTSSEYGRFTKVAAQAKLCKIYLEAKKWQECADMAEEVMADNTVDLVDNWSDLWGVENEKNVETIFSIVSVPSGQYSSYCAHFMPSDYLISDGGSIGWDYYRTTWDFYNSFDPDDQRRADFLTSYTTTEYKVAEVGTGAGEGPIPNKFPLDPDHIGWTEGTDIVLLRLSDIILARAEALNEINGPNQTSIDLINMVRERAFGDTDHNLVLTDYTSTEALRSAILDERGWELFFEGHRRQDLIRHGVYVEKMKAKGSSGVSDTHLLLPVPIDEISLNPNLAPQNPGY